MRGEPGSSRGEEKRARERRAALAMVVAEMLMAGVEIAGAGNSRGGMTPKSIALTAVPSFVAGVAADFPFSGRAPNSLASISNHFYPINRLTVGQLALQRSDLH